MDIERGCFYLADLNPRPGEDVFRSQFFGHLAFLFWANGIGLGNTAF